jgi:hypothetical protein
VVLDAQRRLNLRREESRTDGAAVDPADAGYAYLRRSHD